MVRPFDATTDVTHATGSPGLLELIRRSGDANLGRTLMRLAAQAAAEHRARTVQQDGETDVAPADQCETSVGEQVCKHADAPVTRRRGG